jgi:hypothetical protein
LFKSLSEYLSENAAQDGLISPCFIWKYMWLGRSSLQRLEIPLSWGHAGCRNEKYPYDWSLQDAGIKITLTIGCRKLHEPKIYLQQLHASSGTQKYLLPKLKKPAGKNNRPCQVLSSFLNMSLSEH